MDGKTLFCKMCETKVAAERKFTVWQHVGHEKHIGALQLTSKKKSTFLLLQETASIKDNRSSDFHKNFFGALVSANIQFSTLNNAKLKSFLELHFGHPIPDESSILQLYSGCGKEILPIKNVLSDNRCSLTVDNLHKFVVVYCNNAE